MSNQNNDTGIELTIVMPCLNEEQTLAVCIDKAAGFINEKNISGEIVIADNGFLRRHQLVPIPGHIHAEDLGRAKQSLGMLL